MKDVVINTTEQNLTPAIEEGMGLFIISCLLQLQIGLKVSQI